MATTFNYTKTINSDKLKAQILLANLPILHINCSGTNAITIVMNENLTEEQVEVLDDIVTNHTTTDTQTYVRNRILAAMDFGRNIMADYGATNVLAGRTVEQIQTIMSQTGSVQAALLSGSLYVALDELAQIEPDGTLITEDTLTTFRHKIQAYLGIPLT